MTLESAISSGLPLVGGVSGLAVLVYMALMVHYSRKRSQDIVALSLAVAELRGFLFAQNQVSHSRGGARAGFPMVSHHRGQGRTSPRRPRHAPTPRRGDKG